MADARGLVIAAPSSGSGKTVVTLGLLKAFRDAGLRVGTAKAGPDYIDPRFHEQVTGRACFNLDDWAMRAPLIGALGAEAARDCDVLIVEGVMGLFDGAPGGAGSTAALAKRLGLPVVLVVNAQAQAQSAAALVKGFAGYDPGVRIAGVIFNRTGGPRHVEILAQAMADIAMPMLGALPRDEALAVPSRHLGLVQACESDDLAALIARAGKAVSQHVDLDTVRALAAPFAAGGETAAPLPPLGQHMAIARDRAFAFAYPHMLRGWRDAGAHLSFFSPLADEAPDAGADAVFLPGGYPELHAGRLAAAHRFKAGLDAAAVRGALVYGECGGYMVLGEVLVDGDGAAHAMSGLLPLETSFARRKLHLGYRLLEHDGALPLPRRLKGHEFHYSSQTRQGAGEALFAARDARGTDLGAAGLRRGRIMGSYAHIIDCGE